MRMALKDIVIQDRFVFKKDSVMHMSTHVIHGYMSIWRSNTRKVQADRLKQSQKVQQGTFHAFGGGLTLCPRRDFAIPTITSIISMFVLRYNIEPPRGKWMEPIQNINHLVASVLPPDQDILTSIVPRNAVDGHFRKFFNVEFKSASILSAME